MTIRVSPLGCGILAGLGLALACNRGTTQPGPVPSASVRVEVGLGVCPDLTQCQVDCEKGDATACVRLGNSWAQATVPDPAAALRYYEQGCRQGQPAGCVEAGRVTEFGHGVPKDDARAYDFYRQACEAKLPVGCFNQAVLLEVGRGAPRDSGKARELYGRVCAAGSSRACADARRLSELREEP